MPDLVVKHVGVTFADKERVGALAIEERGILFVRLTPGVMTSRNNLCWTVDQFVNISQWCEDLHNKTWHRNRGIVARYIVGKWEMH